MDIFKILDDLNIDYEVLEHKAIYTVEEAHDIENMIDGMGCKNLFLTDKLDNYYLYMLPDNKRADLKRLCNILNVIKLIFASELDLKDILNLEKGSVTPLGIINDSNNKVTILIDKYLENKKILVHPNINTKTISIAYSDLLKVIDKFKHRIIVVDV